MYIKPIVRGRFYHKLSEDFYNLIRATVFHTNSQSGVERFENQFAEYVERKNCISFGFARSAFYYSLKALNLEVGSKIILPSITIKPMLDVVLDLGYTPLFVDSDLKSGSVNIDSLKLIIDNGSNPVCILLTYLFGITPTNTEVVEICKENNIQIIEDFSQCLNGKVGDAKIGKIGIISIYSSSSVKTLDTYGGGHAFTDDSTLANKLKNYQLSLPNEHRLAVVKKITLSLIKNFFTNQRVFPFVFLFLKSANLLSSARIERFFGLRSSSPIDSLPLSWFRKFSAPQAEYGLRRLSQIANDDRRRIGIADVYNTHLKNANLCNGNTANLNVYWQYIIYADDVQKFRSFLYSHGIDSARTSLVLLSELSEYGIYTPNKNASYIYNNAVYIPCYPHLAQKDQSRIVDAINEYLSR